MWSSRLEVIEEFFVSRQSQCSEWLKKQWHAERSYHSFQYCRSMQLHKCLQIHLHPIIFQISLGKHVICFSRTFLQHQQCYMPSVCLSHYHLWGEYWLKQTSMLNSSSGVVLCDRKSQLSVLLLSPTATSSSSIMAVYLTLYTCNHEEKSRSALLSRGADLKAFLKPFET